MIENIGEALTNSVRSALAKCAEHPAVLAEITAPGLVALNRISHTVKFDNSGKLLVSSEDESWFKEWRNGSSRTNPVPIEELVEKALMGEAGTYFR